MIKARKLREMRKLAAAREKEKPTKPKTSLDVVMGHVYDRGDEVLNQAMAQYPAQASAIVAKIAELIRSGELQAKISGGELLALFRSIRLPVRIDTSIKIADHGKLISFSDKLKHLDDEKT